MTLTIHEIAYKKMIYHCLCYPSSKVYGALIEGDKEEMIVDAYPLFHTPLLAPSLSIAMDLIESNLSENQKICGFYEFVEESECLMNRIIEGNQQLTKMKLIKVTSKNSTFDVSMQKGKWEIDCLKFEDVRENIKKGDHRFIVDFDNHFENIKMDFRNKYVQ